MLGFIVLPAIAEIRNIPLDDLRLSDFTVSFFSLPLEAGHTIRPFYETYQWISGGEAYAYGKTLLIPFENILAYFPGIERPPLDGTRYFLTQRTPTQGYTFLAELYFNFGIYGVIFGTFLLGTLAAQMDKSSRSITSLILWGGIGCIILQLVRGHFLSVPGTTLVVVLFVVAIHVLADLAKVDRRTIRI